MVNIKRYISLNFTKNFLIIFIPFFLILSLGYIVQMSSLTAKIKITFSELLQLYTYAIPDIIFYTLPLSFIAALVNALVKLSQENELIALYSLGLKSNSILKSIFPIGALFSILLICISFLAMPLSIQYFKSFKDTKKTEAKLNITAGEIGQKFGNYYIYIKEQKNNQFQDIVIYQYTNKNEEQFFSSTKGKINKIDNSTSLELDNGYVYTYTKDKLQQAKYQNMKIYNTHKIKNYQFKNILKYWSKIKTDIKLKRKMFFLLLISLIPILSIYPIASFAMINPRYQKNRSFSIIFVVTFLFYILASFLQKQGSILLFLLIISSIVITSKWLFNKRVARFF